MEIIGLDQHLPAVPERSVFGRGAPAPVATSKSPSRGRVKLLHLTCAGHGATTVRSVASQYAPQLLRVASPRPRI